MATRYSSSSFLITIAPPAASAAFPRLALFVMFPMAMPRGQLAKHSTRFGCGTLRLLHVRHRQISSQGLRVLAQAVICVANLRQHQVGIKAVVDSAGCGLGGSAGGRSGAAGNRVRGCLSGLVFAGRGAEGFIGFLIMIEGDFVLTTGGCKDRRARLRRRRCLESYLPAYKN